MEQGTTQARELTAREIFNRIVKGQTVRIPNDPGLAQQLKNHLNVIKSREKKLFESLQLDFISSVVSVEIFPPQQIGEKYIVAGYCEIKLVAPKKRRKYTTFLIHEPNTV